MKSRPIIILFITGLSFSVHAQQRSFSDTTQIRILKKELSITTERAIKINSALQTNNINIRGIVQRKELTSKQRYLLLHELVVQRDSVINTVLTKEEQSKLKLLADKDHEDMRKRYQLHTKRNNIQLDSARNVSH